MKKPELSVVILTCNRPGSCARLISQVAALIDNTSSEIIVVNNGPKNDRLREAAGNIECKVLQMPANIGISARNKGWQAARGDYILMLDDDVEISAGIIDELKNIFKNHADAGIVAFRIKTPSGEEESCLLPLIFHGCACAFRRTALESSGGYPAKFGYYVEEYDLAFRIFKKGYRIAFAENCGAVTHFREQKNRRQGQIICFLVRNNAYLCAAHLPAKMVFPALADILKRCFLVARKEKVITGYLKGLFSIPKSMARAVFERNAFNPGLFEEVSLIAPVRHEANKMTEKKIESVVICGVGRFPSLWLKALKDAGIKKIIFWENNICWKNRKIKGAPVLMTERINAVPLDKETAFLTGTGSRADNRLWRAWLAGHGMTIHLFELELPEKIIIT